MAWADGDSATGGDHADVLAVHDHMHSHMVNGVEMEHSHQHGHAGSDGIHVASDGAHHGHLDRDLAILKPVKKKAGRTVLKADAARAGGHDAKEVAAMYSAMHPDDEIRISCSNSTGGPPVMLTPADEDEHLIGMTAASVIDGRPVEYVSPGELAQAEQEWGATMTGGDAFGLSAADDAALAADTAQGEINRLSHDAAVMQMRECGHRVPGGF